MMKGFNVRKGTPRECKDSIFFITKEGIPNFAVCVFDGMGKYLIEIIF